jgi:MFS family permease
MPIWLLYSLNILHFNSTLAVSVFMSIWIGSAVLEIPTGALADRLGRKKIFIIGQLLFSLYPLAYAFKFPLVALVIVCLISAVGSALRSGALLPIVHASYEKAGLGEKAYNNFLSTNMVGTFIARALTGVAGAALYAVNPKWPFFAMFVVTFLNFGLGFFIRNTPVEEQTTHTNFEHIRQTFGIMKKSQIIVGVLTSFILFNLVAETVWTAYQVFFEADGRAAVTIGTLFSIAAICSAIAAYAVRFIHGRLHPMRLIQLYGLISDEFC